jgi:hypothetical protein
MPIFGRRKLQHMFNELGPYLTRSKATDLLKRLENEDPDQAIPAEYELALAWAVSKVADLEIDRPCGSRTPDIYSRNLVRSAAIVAEVAALSDDPFSGESLMRRAANIINSVAARIVKEAPQHLHYEFLEDSGFLPADRHSNGFTRYFRRRCITRKFQADEGLERALCEWLKSAPPTEPLRWCTCEIHVMITWKDWVHPMTNTFSSMPSVTYDVRNNALYERLKAKARQLEGVENGVLRAIFLGDAGCRLLRELRPISRGREVTGEQIIRAFLARNAVDLVVIFVPKRANEHALWQHDNPRMWFVYAYSNSISDEAEIEGIKSIRDALPSPYLHGYQARSWHQQRMFHPQEKGHYLPAKWTGGRGKMKVHISARGLQEFMAGRLTAEQLKHFIVGDHNPFETALRNGRTIKGVTFESKGIERDDDYLVFEFEEDPAAKALELPSNLTDGV